MRDPLDVGQQICDCLPAERKADMEVLLRSLSYKAPEQAVGSFAILSDMISMIVGPAPLAHEWQIVAVAILMDIETAQVRKRYGVK